MGLDGAQEVLTQFKQDGMALSILFIWEQSSSIFGTAWGNTALVYSLEIHLGLHILLEEQVAAMARRVCVPFLDQGVFAYSHSCSCYQLLGLLQHALHAAALEEHSVRSIGAKNSCLGSL